MYIPRVKMTRHYDVRHRVKSPPGVPPSSHATNPRLPDLVQIQGKTQKIKE